ncbi:MAG: helix-turn-helix transcriptional regulator [Oscillospiraceae bacterium]|nr:helix-turn-helix domain-containing protein [Collinsella sp.]MDY3079011.1 helix-turn-helix transcriptional regulator [Oscillospiraceae bacterium]
MNTIGNRIRLRREELGLSQDELAKMTGYKSRSSINKIELDQRNLRQSKIKAIADALKTTPAYLMGWEDDPKPADNKKDAPALSESVVQLAKVIEQLSPENQKTLAAVAKGLLRDQSEN